MLTQEELKQIARQRLDDAVCLTKNERWDSAVYLCGYAIELALKHQISETMGWDGFPESGKEFDDYKTFRTHKLEVLLHLSGREKELK